MVVVCVVVPITVLLSVSGLESMLDYNFNLTPAAIYLKKHSNHYLG